MSLRPMISFFGSKWRTIPKYPNPRYNVIIEPFAGGATYSLRHYERQVILCDLDPVIFGVWDYLIRVSREEILKLPLDVVDTDELHVPQEAKWFIGFWLNKGVAQPVKKPSPWMLSGEYTKQFWGESVRERVANQVGKIKHWKVFNRSYQSIPNFECTWFVDPPYHRAGKRYKFSSIDYPHLGSWCKHRAGQVIACEQAGADWLDFSHLIDAQSLYNGSSRELIWQN